MTFHVCRCIGDVCTCECTEAMLITALEREILTVCRVRAMVNLYPKDVVDDLVRRGLLDWNASAYIPSRSASTTRAGLVAAGLVER